MQVKLSGLLRELSWVHLKLGLSSSEPVVFSLYLLSIKNHES